jgi:cytochrome c553
MKKVCVMLLGLFLVTLAVSAASALPPFDKGWKAKYLGDSAPASLKEAVATAKCNVCHEGTSKKNHNAYGKAVKKYLTKADFDAVKADAEKSNKYIEEGLAKAEAEKSASGKTFGELIKEGKAPWE